MNYKEIRENLKSGKNSVVLDTLKYIVNQGSKEILIDVINLLNVSKDSIIRNEIIKILENLKIQDCSPIIINTIENQKYSNILPDLVSSCWKNSLNFEDYIEVFTDVFINHEDFQVAFDALTLIDTFEKVDPEKANTCLIKLESFVENAKDNKRPLFFELINIIKDKKKIPPIRQDSLLLYA